MFTDTFGRQHTYLRISVTERCDLRCRYCMPAEGVALTPRDQVLSFEEIVRLARIFVAGGITKIRLTGGEPLVRKDLDKLVTMIAEIDGLEHLAMTTNGMLLDRKAEVLRKNGLQSLNISLDTLKEDRFEAITRRKGVHKVTDAIDLALDLGYEPVKVNSVVLRDVNDDELADFARLSIDRPLHIRFIEYMPFQGNGWNNDKFVSYTEMIHRLEAAGCDLQRDVDAPNDTTKNYKLPDSVGSVGFISSMSDHFCGSCNRIRLTADGNIKVCLFGNSEVSLMKMLRSGCSDDEITQAIDDAVKRKKASHNGMENIAREVNRPMILIGG